MIDVKQRFDAQVAFELPKGVVYTSDYNGPSRLHASSEISSEHARALLVAAALSLQGAIYA